MTKKTANEIIDTIAQDNTMNDFFTKTPAAVATADLDAVVEYYRRDRAQWLASVKKKMEKKG